MTRKIRSLQEASPIRAEADIGALYEELSPPWSVGSADPTPAADWDRAIFGDRKRPNVAGGRRPKHDLSHAG